MRRYAVIASVVAALAISVPRSAAAEPDGALTESTAPVEAPAGYLAVEMGLASPVGLMGMRLSVPLFDRGPWLQAGLGMGFSGLVASGGVAVPFYVSDVASAADPGDSVPPWVNGPVASAIYVGYGHGWLSEAVRHPWAASQGIIAEGSSHWLDLTWLTTIGIFDHGVVIAGLGITGRLSGGTVLASVADEGAVQPSWWVRRRVIPALFTGYGVAF